VPEKTEKELKSLKEIAINAHNDATSKMHEYACALPIGTERIKAFEAYQNIRLATRVG